ncbi:MAG: YncE family protein [Usitatibacter sp.]
MSIGHFPTVLAALLLAAYASVAQAAPFAYVTRGDGVVRVIDTSSQNIVATINTGGRPEGVGINPEGRRAFVANAATNELHVIDTAAHAIIANLSVAPGPSAVVLNPSGTRVYVLHPGSGGASQLTIFNTENLTGAGSLVFANRAERLAMSADGSRLFVSHPNANSVSVVDTASLAVNSIGTGASPYGMAHDPNLNRLYVANAGGTVTVINVGNGTPIATLLLPGCQGSRNVAVNPQGTRLFVTCEDTNNLQAVNLASLQVTTVAMGSRPTAVDVTPDGQLVLVINSASGTVNIQQEDNPAAGRGLVTVGGNPSGFGRFIGGPTTFLPLVPGVLSGLWWNPVESGWGIHLTQRRNTIFAAWFTYDPIGAPRWYVASNCSMSPPLPCPDCIENAFCSGDLFEVNGPRFFHDPFDPRAVQTTRVGILQLEFRDRSNGKMSYVLGSQSRTLQIQRQVFRSGVALAIDYTDLWWNPSESGWGLGITQQSDVMFLTWFVYEDTGRPIWYVASNCTVKGGGNGCTGRLYRVAGPPGPITIGNFDRSKVVPDDVGTIDVTFTDANNGVISYTVENISGSKAITRQLF